ncbi:hypothetical protein FPV67DRAFT_1461898, partial [Lyophyllum atratum]
RAACTPFSVRLTPARALAFNSTLVGKTVHSFIAFVRGNADEADQALRAMMLAYDAHTAPPPPDHVKVSTAAPAHVPAPLATSNQANAAGSGRPRPRPRAKPLSDSARAPDGGRAPSTATPIARTPPAPAPSAATTAIPPSRQPFEIVVPFMPDKGKLREARTTTPPAQTSPAPEVIDDDEIQEIAPEEAAAPPPKGARYIVRKDEFHTPPCASCLAGGLSKKGCSISKARTQPSEQTRQPSEHSNEEEESTAPQSPPVARTRKGAGKARAPAEDTDDTQRRGLGVQIRVEKFSDWGTGLGRDGDWGSTWGTGLGRDVDWGSTWGTGLGCDTDWGMTWGVGGRVGLGYTLGYDGWGLDLGYRFGLRYGLGYDLGCRAGIRRMWTWATGLGCDMPALDYKLGRDVACIDTCTLLFEEEL